MLDVISIGSAVVDIFIFSPAFSTQQTSAGKYLCQQYGAKIEVDSFNVFTGGGASNTAVGFARLGLKTAIICETGRDRLAQLVKQELIDNQVEIRLMIEERKEQTGGSVALVGPDGDRTIMVHRGAGALLDPYDISSYWVSQAKWIHLSNIDGREATLNKIFSLVARNKELHLSWNPGKKELALIASGELVPSQLPVQVLLVNDQEWTLVEDRQAEILRSIHQVIVTTGRAGGDLYFNGEHRLHYPALSTKTVDQTGAGDAFSVGYVYGQLLGKSPVESVQLGALNSASVVKFYGAKAGLLAADQFGL